MRSGVRPLNRRAGSLGLHRSPKRENGPAPQLQALFAAAARREVDVVVFWSLDRFSREGALATLQHLAMLGSYGVRFRSFTEPYLDSCGLGGDAIIAILGTIAKQERVRIVERVKAGLERARAVGTKSGRPIGVFDRARLIQMRNAGASWRAIACALKVSAGTVRRSYSQAVSEPTLIGRGASGTARRLPCA